MNVEKRQELRRSNAAGPHRASSKERYGHCEHCGEHCRVKSHTVDCKECTR